MGFITEVAREFWLVLIEAGWWLLLGFCVAGLLRQFVPTAWIQRHLGGRGAKPIVKASLVGIPMPLCSCSVIPTAAALRRQGVGKGASASFAVSTPEVDVPSVSITWGMLGPALAVARPIGAMLTATTTGLLIDRFAGDVNAPNASPVESTPKSCCSTPPAPVKSCCSSDEPQTPTTPCCGTKQTEPVAPASCCGPEDEPASPGLGHRMLAALRYGFITIPTDLAPWMLVGLLLSALVGVLLPAEWLQDHVGSGVLSMVLALVIGVPLYICATSTTPLVAILVAKGLSPGAALVFLLAGPATNTTTMAWVLKDLGGRALGIYIATIATVSVALGFAFNAFIPTAWTATTPEEVMPHLHGTSVASHIAAGLLALLLVSGLIRRIVQGRKSLEKPLKTSDLAAEEQSHPAHAPA